MNVAIIACLLIPLAMGDNALIGMILDRNPESSYSSADESIFRGVQLYARWINEHGGIQLSDSVDRVFMNVTAVDISQQNSTDEGERIRLAATELLTQNALDIFVAPFAGFRAEQALNIWLNLTQKAIPFLSPVGGTFNMVINGSPNLWFSSSAVGEITKRPLIDFLEKTHGTTAFNLISRKEDSFWGTVRSEALSLFMNGTLYPYVEQNETNPTNADYAEWSVVSGDYDLGGIDGDLSLTEFNSIMSDMHGTFDALVIMGVEAFEASVYNAVVEKNRPDMKAVIIPKPIDFVDQGFLSDHVPEYWIFSSSLHPDMNYGQPGKYMGTTADFFAYHQHVYGVPLNGTYSGFSAAALVALQICIERAGSQWRNATRVTLERSRLSVYDATAETFWGRTQYSSFGVNLGKKSATVQYVGNELRLIRSPQDLVYPAPWPWLESQGDGLDTEATIGITVGVFVGVVLILIVLIAIASIIFAVVYKKKFYMIFLPKGNTTLRENA